jgi:hypothetical protein
MTLALVRCDGAPRPAGGNWDTEIAIGHRGAPADLNLSLMMPGATLLPRFDDRSTDLVRIASYVFGADQEVSRGGTAAATGKSWTRDFTVCIPVTDPAFWASREVRSDLQTLLGWVSDDVWRFEFSQATPESSETEMFNIDPNEVLGKPDCVVLFSGGLDSLAAVVEKACLEGRRPLLVSHAPMFNLRGWQGTLLDELRRSYGQWHFPRVGCAIHRRGSHDPHETTNRSRPFLHAALGAAIAHAARVNEVYLADNGVVSLNLPINDQLLGARASRSTHPRFIREFESFVNRLWSKKVSVTNPLWSRTRPETLAALEASGVLPLIDLTHSCARQRFRTRAQPHCGVCSQCIDRRFATLGAGFSEFDAGERYEIDIFRHALKEGDARTMALSYVRHATELSELSAEQLFSRFSQLFDCIPNGREQTAVAESLTAMLHRHGEGVVRVMADQIALARESLARGKLPPTCLLALVASQSEEPVDASGAEQGPIDGGPRQGARDNTRTTSSYARWLASLPAGPRAVVSRLEQAQRAAEEPTRWGELRSAAKGVGINPTRMHDVFRHHPRWREFIEELGHGYWRLVPSGRDTVAS